MPSLKLTRRAPLFALAAALVACSSGTAGAQGAVGQHPRLLITPAMIADLRARTGDPDLAAVMADANALVTAGLDPGYQGTGYSDSVPIVGLAYLITGDAKYARPLLDMLDTLNAAAAGGDVSAVSVDSTYASRSTALAVALAFDWAYPELGATRTAATVKTVNAYFDWFLTGDRVADRDGPAYSNYFVGHLNGFGATGYATDGDNPRAAEIIAKMSSLYDANIPASFTSGAAKGGFPVEGYVYGANTFVRLFNYLRMVETATGRKVGDSAQWANDILLTMLAALKPNLWQLSDEGEYTGDNTGFLEPNQLQTFTSLAADATARGYGSWLLQNRKTAAMGTFADLQPMTRLLYPVSEAPVDYRTMLPTYRTAAGAATSMMRSSWDDNAVWASFNANFKRYTGHVGRQTGHFTIQRGSDYLLINASQWKQNKVSSNGTLTGYSGPGYTGNTFVSPSSSWTNTLFADDGTGGYLIDGDSYVGGQAGFADNQPYVLSESFDSTYVKLDATRAYQDNRYPTGYDQRSVTLFVRNFAFFAPGNFVVFDRVRVRQTSVNYDLRFYFNSNSPPTLSGGIATSTIGGSRLYMRPVLPVDVNMRVGWQQLENVNFAPRVELRPASASTQFDAMTVFTAASTDFAGMPGTNVIRSQGDSMVGVQILEPQRERVALFASAETDRVAGAVTYAVTSTGGRHSLFDLTPSAAYAVTASDAGGGAVTISVTPGSGSLMTDTAGVLTFDVAGTTVTALPAAVGPVVTEPERPSPPANPGNGSGGESPGGGGCGCRSAPGPATGLAALLVMLVVLAWRWRFPGPRRLARGRAPLTGRGGSVRPRRRS